MNKLSISEEEQEFVKMYAQDSSPRMVAKKRVNKLRQLNFNNNEIFTNLKKDFNKHFTDPQIVMIVNE
ncbi:hypothetical protein GCM10022297_04430 [Lactobacillus hamsteri]|uniref:Uncharacterized protein n=1 Tax=Lactobacillus hamsteri DSM 5661 = JCM 6256 TaxID=1423754 RepID=A0A0R1YCL3_9LACO|nr:hypothetical protein [Lactobacillus hamsteri]KRM37174.1 hypothetical protein FC39_GL000281 [Lactobacillus hamsteri DSM 5661 = JCM 6256]